MSTIPHSDIIARWSDPESRPLFKGSLIDADGCCCAQGDILRTYCGWDDDDLRADGAQKKADKEVAERLGITTFQSVLIRIVNDRKDGCPQDVLANPEKVIGDQAPVMLAFARHLDRMTHEQWYAAMDAARYAARYAAMYAAMDAARYAAMDAAMYAARYAAMDAARYAAMYASYAMNEIQGASIMRANGTPFYFLPLFGFADPEAVMAEDAKHANP